MRPNVPPESNNGSFRLVVLLGYGAVLMPNAAIKMFFLDNPVWAPPVGAGPTAGSISLLGAGKMIPWAILTMELLKWTFL